MTAPLNPSTGADAGKASSGRGETTRFNYYGERLPDDQIAGLHDQLVCRDNRDGALIVRRHTERFVPVPRKATP